MQGLLLEDEEINFEDDFLQIKTRPAVAVKHTINNRYILFYLSLFDDEIVERFEEFLIFGSLSSWDRQESALAALRLEPTDAVVVRDLRGGVWVMRGGACNFPLYWTHANNLIQISTMLPIDQTRIISRRGLLASISSVSMPGQYEPNSSLLTPLQSWRRLRRGTVTEITGFTGNIFEYPIDFSEIIGTFQCNRDYLIQELQAALDKFGYRQRHHSRMLVELSGGFDSTIAAIGALKYDISLDGVSEHFPYYEFRFEEAIQQSIAKSLGVDRYRLDGTTFLPYAPSEWLPQLDEPSISILGSKIAVTIAREASAKGIRKILVGHGGDQLFCEGLLEKVDAPKCMLTRGIFSSKSWKIIKEIHADFLVNPTSMNASCLTCLYDARFDVAFKEKFNIVNRSPFTDLLWVRCGIIWNKVSEIEGIPLGKSILEDAFGKEIPSAVISRKGKVPWDGVCARAYSYHANDIVNQLEYVVQPLEGIGINVRSMMKRVSDLANVTRATYNNEDKDVIAGYALASWLNSWGINQLNDCNWCE